MPCTNPKKCWHVGTTENGKKKYVFKRPPNHWNYEQSQVPCGKCINCHVDKAREWATRATHEAQLHDNNCFVTLTYSDEHLPENATLKKEDLQKFIKLVRYHFRPLEVKYLACGEYGSESNTHRPHYHICFFGIDAPDKELFFTNRYGDPIYRSELFERIWKKGHVTIGQFNYRTASYTARYTIKKMETSENYQFKHEIIDKYTGETNYDPVAARKYYLMRNKIPEFITMSQGIGRKWHDKFKSDTHKDYITVNNHKAKIPKYYDKLLERKDPERLEQIKEARVAKAKELQKDKTKSILNSKDVIMKKRIKNQKRILNNGN